MGTCRRLAHAAAFWPMRWASARPLKVRITRHTTRVFSFTHIHIRKARSYRKHLVETGLGKTDHMCIRGAPFSHDYFCMICTHIRIHNVTPQGYSSDTLCVYLMKKRLPTLPLLSGLLHVAADVYAVLSLMLANPARADLPDVHKNRRDEKLANSMYTFNFFHKDKSIRKHVHTSTRTCTCTNNQKNTHKHTLAHTITCTH